MTPTHAVTAPGELETLRRFINTRDIEASTDTFDSPAAVRRWFAQAGLWNGATTDISQSEAKMVREFREALRTAIIANHDDEPLPDHIVAIFNDTAARAGFTWSISADRRWSLASTAPGAAGATGRLVAIMSEAMAQGTWRRLKACGSDTCVWAFYDHSRASTGRWCSMKLCGNRAKQENWRSRRRKLVAHE